MLRQPIRRQCSDIGVSIIMPCIKWDLMWIPMHADSKDPGEMPTMNRLKYMYEISLVVNEIYTMCQFNIWFADIVQFY